MDTIAKTVTSKAGAFVLTIAMVATLVAPVTARADNHTVEALNAQVNALLAQLNALQGGNDTNQSSGVGSGQYVHHASIDYEFNTNLYVGSKGQDVQMLQTVLNLKASTQVAASGAGSPGNETEYFGPATLAAVKVFQTENGISPVAGYFWPLTRAEMNRKAAGSSTTNNNSSSSSNSGERSSNNNSGDADLYISEGNSPKEITFAPRQQLVQFTVVELTAGDNDVVVEEIYVQVNGEDSDSDDVIDSVIVMDEDGVILDEDSPDSDDLAELDLRGLEIEDGETIVLVFAANISSTEEDDSEFTLEVVDIDTDADDIDGLPIEGTEQTINANIDLAEVSVEIKHENTSNVEIGSEEELITKLEFEATEDEDVIVRSIRLEFGSLNDIDEDDIDNVELRFDDDKVADGRVDNDGITFSDVDITIEDGDSEDFEVYADVVSGANGEIQLVIEDLSDIIVENDDGAILPISLKNDGADRDYVVAISTGDIDLSESDEVNSGSVAVGEEEAELVAFEFEVEGEAVLVDNIDVTIKVEDMTNDDRDDIELTNIEIIDSNGDRVESADDDAYFSLTDPNSVTINFEDVEFPEAEGDDAVYYIIADLTDDVEHGTSYTVTDIVMKGIEGIDSEEDIADPDVLERLNEEQTVKGASLIVGVSSSIEEDETLDDEKEVELAIVQLDATDSGEDVTVKELSLKITVVSSDATVYDVSNCELYEIEEDGEFGDSVSDSVDFDRRAGLTDEQEFDLDNYVVSSGDLTPLSLRCDISNDFAEDDTITIDVSGDAVSGDADSVDADGEVTKDIVATLSNALPVTVTVIDGELATSNDENADPAIARAGERVSLGKVEINSDQVEGVLEEIGLTISDATLLSSKRKVEIHLNGDYVGDATFSGTNSKDTVDSWKVDAELEDGQNIIEFFAKTAPSVNDEGVLLSVNIDGDVDIKVGGDLYDVAETTIEGVKVYTSIPEIKKEEEEITSSDISNDVIAKFAITADGKDDIVVDFASTTVSVTTTGDATATGNVRVEEANSEYESNGTAAGEVTITGNSTEYFVVRADVVAEGDNGNIIKVTIDFDTGSVQVNGTSISPLEGGDLTNSGVLISKYTN